MAALSKFAPQPIPYDAPASLRAFLNDQLARLQPLVNGAAQIGDDETITGDWTFTGAVDLSGATLTLDEDYAIADANEGISGTWTFQNGVIVGDGDSSDGDILINFSIDRSWSFRAVGEGSSNHLALRSDAGGGKIFYIQDDNAVDQFAFRTLDGAFYAFEHGGSGDYVSLSHTGDMAILGESGASTLGVVAQAFAGYYQTTMGLADDDTGTFQIPNDSRVHFVMLTTRTSSADENVCALLYFSGTGTATEILNTNPGVLAVGVGANPDLDGDINIWKSANDTISVRNRRGGFRYVSLHVFG